MKRSHYNWERSRISSSGQESHARLLDIWIQIARRQRSDATLHLRSRCKSKCCFTFVRLSRNNSARLCLYSVMAFCFFCMVLRNLFQQEIMHSIRELGSLCAKMLFSCSVLVCEPPGPSQTPTETHYIPRQIIQRNVRWELKTLGLKKVKEKREMLHFWFI